MSIIGGTLLIPYGVCKQAKYLNSSEQAVLPMINSNLTVLPIERKITFTPNIYQQIADSIGSYPVEQGGILGSSDYGKTIDHFYWDRHASTSPATYSPNVELINKKILPEWNTIGVRLVGFIHSHPRDHPHPSSGDKIYTKRLLKALHEEWLYLPIVQKDDKGSFAIFGYGAETSTDEMPVIRRYEIYQLEQSRVVP